MQIGGEFYFFPGTDVAQIEYVAKEEGGCILLTISQGVVCSYAALFGRHPFYLLTFPGSFFAFGLILVRQKDFVRRAVYWKHYWPKGITELDQTHTGM